VSQTPLRDLELLIRASHPLVLLDTEEEDRARAFLDHAVDHLGLPTFRWNAAMGLKRLGEAQPVYGTQRLDGCLDHIASSGATRVLYHLEGAVELFDDPDRTAKLVGLCDQLAPLHSTLLMSGAASALPARIQRRATRVTLEPPSDQEYYRFINGILGELRKRQPVRMDLDAEQAAKLVASVRGLTLFEVRKIVTQAILRDGQLGPHDLEFVLDAKRDVVQQSGVLEYYAAEQGLDDIAGLSRLKHWLSRRAPVFDDPSRAEAFGLSAPRGLLLLGVQGCGKSMCAKAVARAFSLPLLRLDPSRLYNKYLGESERNLRKAIAVAERLSPVVLWIDEIEKVLGPSKGEDTGASQRIFGSFLTWLGEKRAGVFVIATANDITSLPPELLRKGRFDEIFFVDLPSHEVRAEILALHLAKRKRDPGAFDLDALAALTEGFSGAELEQVVVAALYAAFADGTELDEAHLRDEIAMTQPLSVTMSEPILALRSWAKGRTVPAD
jgi:AAA+ superfamily predicted ATPase